MWGSRRDRTGDSVTCIACGDDVDRTDAREYDKYGDRWDREDKEFEYLCKPCHRAECHQPRDGLEDLLVDAEAGTVPREEFYARFAAATDDQHEHVE
ncbi:DUF7562 family protein [Haloarchaeobius sp. HRN-SO-5]|uniref:DUF7562 family protein n=1 Tax=Haloarchaeobius sp. HRN-SO-5 TaxID=3446118 RepID=UPI003EB857A9